MGTTDDKLTIHLIIMMSSVYIRVCRKTLFSSDQFETPGELSLGMDY